MKFTEEEAYNELVSKLKEKEANPLINERAIKAIIADDFKLFADVDIELNKYVEVKVNTLKENDGNVRRVVKESVLESQKKEKERLDEESKKKSQEEKDDKAKDNVDKDDKYSALEAKINSLLDIENKRTLDEKKKNQRKELISKIEKLGVNDSKWTDKLLDKISLTDESDLDEEAKSLVELYNIVKADTDPFTPPRSTYSKSKDDDILESIRKEREESIKNEQI